MIIKVFPDYCSTGLWNESGININIPNYVKYNDSRLLELWHDYWEIEAQKYLGDNNYVMNNHEWWKELGTLVVARLNSYRIDEYILEAD